LAVLFYFLLRYRGNFAEKMMQMKLKFIILSAFLIHTISLKAQAQQVTEDGKLIFEKNCTRCHGYDGTKGYWGAKNLRKSKLDDEKLYATIANGRWIMPSWKRKLTPDQIHAVIAYIKTLRN